MSFSFNKLAPSKPGATGGSSEPLPPHHCLSPPKREISPPSEVSAPKKVTSSVPMECSSEPETPKILVIMGKNRFFANFAINTFLSSSQTSWNFAHILQRRPLFFFGLHPSIFIILRIFRDEDLSLWSTLSNSREKSFCAFLKIVFAPPPSSHATLAPGLPPP